MNLFESPSPGEKRVAFPENVTSSHQLEPSQKARHSDHPHKTLGPLLTVNVQASGPATLLVFWHVLARHLTPKRDGVHTTRNDGTCFADRLSANSSWLKLL
ncbi:unnamed protein product [Durusdinium trenchii]|uniref:Uncharacterized protein n=1 Tax=Durusdinium trenchii TaxID=1381693 RepID=A0ABP0L1B3_9DINO